MKRGVPPTARNARTGELTPPGVTRRARSKSACEAGASYGWVTGPVSQSRPVRPGPGPELWTTGR